MSFSVQPLSHCLDQLLLYLPYRSVGGRSMSRPVSSRGLVVDFSRLACAISRGGSVMRGLSYGSSDEYGFTFKFEGWQFRPPRSRAR